MKGYLLCFLTCLVFVCGVSAQKQKRTKKPPPQNLDSLISAAQKDAYKSDYAGAMQILKTVSPQNDTNPDYLTFYGAVLSWMGKYDSAQTVLRGVIAKHPNSLDAYDALTDVELWAKEYSQVIEDCNKALAIPKVKSETYTLKIAEAEINLKEYIKAYDIVRPILKKNPKDTSAKNMNDEITAAVTQKTADSLFDSALHSSFRKQFIPAEKVAKELTLEYPDNSDYKVLWSRLLGYRGKADTSEIMLREVINKEPQNLDAYDAFADDELVTGRFKHSEQLADSGINIPVKADRTALVITKASAEDNLEEYYQGVMTLDTLVKKHPNNSEAVNMYKLLKAHYKEFKERNREDSLLTVAKAEAGRKHYDSALTNVDTIIKWDSINSVYKVYKANLFNMKEKYDTAITILTPIIKKEPRNLDAYDILTDAELGKKQFAAMVADCDKALRDSIFIHFPTMVPRNKDSAAMDSIKKDSTHLNTTAVAVSKRDTTMRDSISIVKKDTSKAAVDSDARRYYTIFMLKRARALYYMDNFAGYQGCVNTLDTLRKVDSTNKEANDLLVEAKIKLLKNIVQLGYLGNYFNQCPFGPWHYLWLQYMRNFDRCPVSAQAMYGDIYGFPPPINHETGWQYQVGAYPKFTNSTYGDATVAYSPDHAVFPQWVITADVYQKLPLNFEVSVGGMYMHFIDVIDSPATAPQDVWIFDPSIAWNYGDHWVFMYRPYIAYKKPDVFVTHTVDVKYIFKNSDTYLSLLGVIGNSPFVDYYFPIPQKTAIRQVGLEGQMRLPHNFLIGAMVSYEYFEWYPPDALWGNMYYFQVVLTKRF